MKSVILITSLLILSACNTTTPYVKNQGTCLTPSGAFIETICINAAGDLDISDCDILCPIFRDKGDDICRG